MDTLIESLLSLAHGGRTVDEFGPLALDELVRQCWTHFETTNAEICVNASATVRADESRLARVFENLFRNAIEHGGEDVMITVGTLSDGFYVEDNGPGIPADEREDVFIAGYSSTSTGTGFGLSIVREIVDAHGWDISVSEGSTGGVRFEITNVRLA